MSWPRVLNVMRSYPKNSNYTNKKIWIKFLTSDPPITLYNPPTPNNQHPESPIILYINNMNIIFLLNFIPISTMMK